MNNEVSITPTELSLMENRKCIVKIHGLKPFFDDKYEYSMHPNYKLTWDADPNRIYHISLDNSKY